MRPESNPLADIEAFNEPTSVSKEQATWVRERIKTLLEKRRERLPGVHVEIERWQRIDRAVEDLDAAVAALRSHVRIPPEVKDRLGLFQPHTLRQHIAKTLDNLTVLENRFSRDTINIGVSGRARVGKSTLLQSMSGLTDDQIPTGSGLPVTAVRSRIFHSGVEKRAILSLHTFDSFREQMLVPYHEELGLSEPAASPDTFRHWSYPTEANSDKHSHVTILQRLRDMQAAFPTYESELTGGERVVDLDGLRSWVAYPTDGQVEKGNVDRRYLAVHDVRIECPFPYAQVEQVGIIDLPGLGELDPKAEKHHLAGLRNEVDLVMLVKRPVEGMAYWGADDGATTNLLDDARGFIKSRRDFVFIVLNRGQNEIDNEKTTALRNDIRRKANAEIDGQHFKVLEGDATNQRSVFEDILQPVLSHLAERLPTMDEEVFHGTRQAQSALKAEVRRALEELEPALTAASQSVGSPSVTIDAKADALRKELHRAIDAIVTPLRNELNADDVEFANALNVCHEGIASWISDGFGKGVNTWHKEALAQLGVDRNSGPFTTHELNRVRNELTRRYTELDAFFKLRVEQLWSDVATAIKPHVGSLLGTATGREALHEFQRYLASGAEPAQTLSRSVQDLIDVRLEYWTHLHPYVRSAVNDLNAEIVVPGEPVRTGRHSEKRNSPSRRMMAQVTVEVSENGVKKLFYELSALAQRHADNAKQALQKEMRLAPRILYATAEQFEDSLIRSGDSLQDFQRFARSYRDRLWPDIFAGFDEAKERIEQVRRAFDMLREQVGEV